MIQCAIFDLDGVIIDSEPIHFRIEQKMFRELKIKVSQSAHAGYVGMSSENMWEDIIKKFGLSVCVQELVQKKNLLYIQYLSKNRNIQPVAGVFPLIRELRENGFILLVASSSPREVIDLVLRKFRLAEFFSARVSGTELQQSKPHPGIFLKAASLANTEPQNCVVIEDAENGVKAAKAAGMKCIGFLNPNSGGQNLEKADLIICSFAELSLGRIRNL
jgi:HAD superfamily hydrolase (TIGR01509 family)